MTYLAAFASSASLEGFRLPEFLSVAATLDIPITLLDEDIPWMREGGDAIWFSVFQSPATINQLKQLAARCMLLRGIFYLFETTPTLEDLYACLDARTTGTAAAAYNAFEGESEGDHLSSSTTYCYQVETIGKKYTGEAKWAVLEEVRQRVPLQGEVDFRTPQRSYFVFLQHVVDRAPGGTQGWVPNGRLLRVFHCCLCVESSRCAMLATYDLKRRPYIGTTSMPPEESMVMANMSRVCPGHFVHDPFCGTGSLLVAAAHCGAKTFGADADGRALRSGTEKGKTSPQLQQQRQLALATYSAEQLSSLSEAERVLPTMWTNFKLYGLPPPDLARMNFSSWQRTWHVAGSESGAVFDSIISDPPYGLREPRKKVEVGTTADATTTTTTLTMSAYATNEVVLDLVLFAAEHLAVGGHLTFWHPTTDHYTDEELPSHPSLRILHNIPQRISLKVVRRLIVMQKVSPVPSPRPSREDCAAKRAADDLRAMMGATALPDNVDYTRYRAKRERRRQAAEEFKRATPASEGDGTGSASSTGGGGNRRGRKHNRLDGQEAIVANRLRNIAVREAKQIASHIANAAHKTTTATPPPEGE